MPHLRDDARSARKLRRPAALLVATLSSCGTKTTMPGGSPVKKVASRKKDFFASGDGGLHVTGFKLESKLERQPSNARGFQKTKKKEQRILWH